MAFNLHKYSMKDISSLLLHELHAYDIYKEEDHYICRVGDGETTTQTLEECLSDLDESINEIRRHILVKWGQLSGTISEIVGYRGTNSGTLDNLVFLNSIKKSYALASCFSDLDHWMDSFHALFNVDLAQIPSSLVQQFNEIFLEIASLHRLIMSEIYRKKILGRYLKLIKNAQVSGPWANLDLTMEERVWEWDSGEEEYFTNRMKSRKEQSRYNPEYNSDGFYLVWQEKRRDPYRFSDLLEDGVYPHRSLLAIN